jgi:hypothetical protein
MQKRHFNKKWVKDPKKQGTFASNDSIVMPLQYGIRYRNWPLMFVFIKKSFFHLFLALKKAYLMYTPLASSVPYLLRLPSPSMITCSLFRKDFMRFVRSFLTQMSMISAVLLLVKRGFTAQFTFISSFASSNKLFV